LEGKAVLPGLQHDGREPLAHRMRNPCDAPGEGAERAGNDAEAAGA